MFIECRYRDKAKTGLRRNMIAMAPKNAYITSESHKREPTDLGAASLFNPRALRPRRNKVRNSRRRARFWERARSAGKSGTGAFMRGTFWRSLPRAAQFQRPRSIG